MKTKQDYYFPKWTLAQKVHNGVWFILAMAIYIGGYTIGYRLVDFLFASVFINLIWFFVYVVGAYYYGGYWYKKLFAAPKED